jgi:molybdopterin synthase catalytic subunit
MIRVEVRETGFDPWALLREHEQAHGGPRGGIGATAVFVGSMRDFNDAHEVDSMFLEHYPGMTERHLGAICQEAAGRWELLDTLVVHRVGEVRVTDPIVLVAVWSSHRKDAFEASRFIMEDLKSRAPFWKKERLADGGDRWVGRNTPGY